MPTITCTKCPKTFTHATDMQAQQALRMHIGRTHEQRIMNGNTVQKSSRRVHRSAKLLPEQAEKVVAFIHKNKSNFSTKTACLAAALEAAGAKGAITLNSTAVTRYFDKAEALAAQAMNGHAPSGKKEKRNYTRKAQPATQHVHVNFCPNCGCSMQAVATGMAMAAQLK